MSKFTHLITVSLLLIAMMSCSKNQLSLTPSPRQVTAGTLLETKVFSKEFNDSMVVDIYLPSNFDAQKESRVVYVHDGQNMFDKNTTWNHQSWGIDNAVQGLIDSSNIVQSIFVCIHSNGETRVGDLMPMGLFSLITDTTTIKTFDAMSKQQYKGDEYLSFIVNTLKPLVDNTYKVKDNAIMGSSMGGLISLYGILAYPEIFSSAVCVSTHVNNPNENGGLYEAYKVLLNEKLPLLTPNHRIYIDTGDKPCDDAYVPYFYNMADLISMKSSAQLMYKFFPGDDHSENSWEKRVHIPLQFILAE